MPQTLNRIKIRACQRGIAALEFSLTLTVLLLFICGVVGFGALFWMQQQLAAAAADGARAAVHARFSGQSDVPAIACGAAMRTFSA
ncbi:pilus assembly protein, partial [Achromobacter animicus]